MISGSDIFRYKKNVRLAVVGVISYVIYVDAFSVFLNIEENLLENKKTYAYVLWLYYCQNKLLLIAC